MLAGQVPDWESELGYGAERWSAYDWFQVAVARMCCRVHVDSSFDEIGDFATFPTIESPPVLFARFLGRLTFPKFLDPNHARQMNACLIDKKKIKPTVVGEVYCLLKSLYPREKLYTRVSIVKGNRTLRRWTRSCWRCDPSAGKSYRCREYLNRSNS